MEGGVNAQYIIISFNYRHLQTMRGMIDSKVQIFKEV